MPIRLVKTAMVNSVSASCSRAACGSHDQGTNARVRLEGDFDRRTAGGNRKSLATGYDETPF